MVYRVLADLVVIIHLGFVVFVGLGGLLAIRYRRCAWIHIPAALWGAVISFAGWVCPLTPLENWLRVRGGAVGYNAGFIEHYIVPVLYPTVLTRTMQVGVGVFVLVLNVAVYGRVFRRYWWRGDRGIARPT